MIISGICELVQNVGRQIFLNFVFTFDKFCFYPQFYCISEVECNNLYNKYYQNRENKSKIQSFISFKEITDIISIYLIIDSQMFSICVCCPLSQLHLLHATMSKKISFFLHSETKQISSYTVVHVSCLSSQVHCQVNMSCQIYSSSIYEPKKFPYVQLRKLTFYNISPQLHHNKFGFFV